jgi:HAD superfamily hydrolase (TIGR01509 family)
LPIVRPVIFLDDGGVMNDNALRGPQWERLVGEFFVPRLGGDPAAWAAANHVVATEQFRRFEATLDRGPTMAYADFRQRDTREWLVLMCERVGVAPPADDQIVPVADESARWITRRVRSACPGAVDAIRTLYGAGYRLMTASGEDSLSLDGYLDGMGVRSCFERLYGPDLIDTFKCSPDYYRRLLADCGVDPHDALVVDDSPKVVAWAREAGATALHVGTDLAALAALPAWLNR